MKCEEISELLPELLSGALGRKAEQEALAHLARCGECRAELAFWAQVCQAVRAEKAEMPQALFKDIRKELMGTNALTVLESLKTTGRALGLAGTACKLAFSAVGLNR